jgi:hypothetical protein
MTHTQSLADAHGLSQSAIQTVTVQSAPTPTHTRTLTLKDVPLNALFTDGFSREGLSKRKVCVRVIE